MDHGLNIEKDGPARVAGTSRRKLDLRPTGHQRQPTTSRRTRPPPHEALLCVQSGKTPVRTPTDSSSTATATTSRAPRTMRAYWDKELPGAGRQHPDDRRANRFPTPRSTRTSTECPPSRSPTARKPSRAGWSARSWRGCNSDTPMGYPNSHRERADVRAGGSSRRRVSPAYFLVRGRPHQANAGRLERHPGRSPAVVRRPVRSWRTRWASPTSTRSCTACLFERFLNPERPSAPDIDIDFRRPVGRGEMIHVRVQQVRPRTRSPRSSRSARSRRRAAIKDSARRCWHGQPRLQHRRPDLQGRCRRRSWPRTFRCPASSTRGARAVRRGGRGCAGLIENRPRGRQDLRDRPADWKA